MPIRPGRLRELQAQGLACVASLDEAKRLGATGVVIGTDTGRHPQDALEALDLQLAVLCEKPLGMTYAEAMPLKETSVRCGVPLFTAMCLRFSPTLRRFEEYLPEVGHVHSVRGECRSYLPDWHPGRDHRQGYSARAGEGGVILDLIHDVDLAVYLFGVPRRVYGTTANLGRLDIASEEMAEAFLEVEGGPNISLALDYLSRTSVRFIRAAGDRGDIIGDFVGMSVTLTDTGRGPEVFSTEVLPQNVYLEQMRAFIGVLEGGGSGQLASVDEGLRGLAICDAWKRSAETGLPEELLR